jgi:hypothetical protein
VSAKVFEVRPGAGIGPIEIGMTREQARAAATAAGLSVCDFRRGGGEGPPDYFIADQLFAYFDDGDHVEEVEVAVGGDHAVTCLDLDLAAPFAHVIAEMSAIARIDKTNPDPAGCAFPEIGLDFWSESGPSKAPKLPVEAILVRRPEHYPVD